MHASNPASPVLTAVAASLASPLQGDLCWEAHKTGDAAADWPLLHSVSCNNPDLFWTAVLTQLRVQFSTPPSRILQDNPQQPDQVRWLPGGGRECCADVLH